MPRVPLLLVGLLALGMGSLQAQHPFEPTLGASIGWQSSDHDHFIYAFHLTLPLGGNWELAPWFRISTASQAKQRASLPLRRLFPLSPNGRLYAGGGVSWTNDIGEISTRGHWGAVGFVGSEFAPSVQAWDEGRVRLFSELQLFTHHYGTGQFLLGLRIRLGR